MVVIIVYNYGAKTSELWREFDKMKVLYIRENADNYGKHLMILVNYDWPARIAAGEVTPEVKAGLAYLSPSLSNQTLTAASLYN